MRSITSKRAEEKKTKRNQIVVGLILIFVMFSSVLGFAFINFSASGGSNTNPRTSSTNTQNNFNSVNYNGFEFIEQNNFWILNQNGINLIFRHNPHQVPQIYSNIKPLENYQNKTMYLYSEDVLAESEIYVNLFGFKKNIENACLEECEEEFPIRTCEDNFIIIREGDRGITQENNCVFIEGKKEDLTKIADEFLFKLMGIEN